MRRRRGRIRLLPHCCLPLRRRYRAPVLNFATAGVFGQRFEFQNDFLMPISGRQIALYFVKNLGDYSICCSYSNRGFSLTFM